MGNLFESFPVTTILVAFKFSHHFSVLFFTNVPSIISRCCKNNLIVLHKRKYLTNGIFSIQAKQCFSVLPHSVILNAIQYFSEAMRDHFGAETFEHQVSFELLAK